MLGKNDGDRGGRTGYLGGALPGVAGHTTAALGRAGQPPAPARCHEQGVFPSDHYVDDGSAFREHVARAILLVDMFPTRIVLFGIRPTHPEPAFGYIEPGPPLVVPGIESPAAYQVAAFPDKPSVEA